jgi:hypothetical protein
MEVRMKGKISLRQFIEDVKVELREAQDRSGDPFYELHEVELEVSFSLEMQGGGKAKLVVVELVGTQHCGGSTCRRKKERWWWWWTERRSLRQAQGP